MNTHCWHGAAAAASLAATLLPRCCLAAVTLTPRCNCCGCPCRCCCCSCCRCFCGLLQTPALPLIPRPLQPGHKLASQSSFLSAERCQSSLGLRDHLISGRASPGDTEHRRSWLNAAAYRWHAQATSWLLPRAAGNGMCLGSISRDPHVAVGRLIPFLGGVRSGKKATELSRSPMQATRPVSMLCYVRVLRKAPVGFTSFAIEPQNDNDILEIRSIPYSHLRCESGTALYGAEHHTVAQCYRHLSS